MLLLLLLLLFDDGDDECRMQWKSAAKIAIMKYDCICALDYSVLFFYSLFAFHNIQERTYQSMCISVIRLNNEWFFNCSIRLNVIANCASEFKSDRCFLMVAMEIAKHVQSKSKEMIQFVSIHFPFFWSNSDRCGGELCICGMHAFGALFLFWFLFETCRRLSEKG